MTDDSNEIKRNGNQKIGRRHMLAKLGIVAGAAYMAPAMLSLSQAKASSGSFSAPSRASYSAPSRRSFSSPSGPRAAGARGSTNRRTLQQWWRRRFR